MAGIPDWLKPADPARYYQEAFGQAAAVSEANARLQQSANETQLRLTLAQQQQERENAIAQQKIETEKAYHQQTVDLAKQRLDAVKQQADAKAAIAAKTLDAQNKFNQLVASGIPAERAMFISGLGTARLAAEYDKNRATTASANARAAIDQQRLEQARQRGVLMGSDTTTDSTGAKHTTYNRQQFNGPLPPPAPSEGVPPPPNPNINAPVAPATPDAAANPLGAQTTALGGDADMVSVTSPDGRTGRIPRAQLGTAIKRGFKQVQADNAAEAQADDQ